jgi:hypothetical protein
MLNSVKDGGSLTEHKISAVIMIRVDSSNG